MTTKSDVDEYYHTAGLWPDEARALRAILLDTALTEAFKWRAPCYTFDGTNIVNIGELKRYCVLGFFKGSLLKDPHGVLTKPGENCRSARRICFTSVDEVAELEPVLKSYIDEAIQLEQSGAKVDFEQDRDLEIPNELQAKFDESPAFETAFNALTPGRRRAYVLHFSAAKQSKTRSARIEKFTQRIFDGQGLNDCVCGLSKRMPSCDGSHKAIR